MEAKKFTFRYSEAELGEVIERGFTRFKKDNKTKEFSLNQLIAICIQKAVDVQPAEIERLLKVVAETKALLQEARLETEQKSKQLASLKTLLRDRARVEAEIANWTQKEQP